MAALVHSNSPALRLLGGERILAGLEQRTAELRLPDCPFCGGGPQVCFFTDGPQLCAAVRCVKCGTVTGIVRGTDPGAMLAACALRWSRRE